MTWGKISGIEICIITDLAHASNMNCCDKVGTSSQYISMTQLSEHYLSQGFASHEVWYWQVKKGPIGNVHLKKKNISQLSTK